MSFHEILLDVEYSALARGGPGFSTAVIPSASGLTKRNANRQDPVGRWAISYDLLDDDALRALYEFFVARKGMAYGFRFLAPEAHEIPAASPVRFGVGDGAATSFKLYRRITSGPTTYDYQVCKPMAGGLTHVPGADTIKIYKAGALQTKTTHYTINSETGVVTFVAAPAAGQELTWSGTYHVPARFNSDDFESEVDTGGVSAWGIEVVEILPAELGL
jgi:uncharacterized protein (TIGR02217 family)